MGKVLPLAADSTLCTHETCSRPSRLRQPVERSSWCRSRCCCCMVSSSARCGPPVSKAGPPCCPHTATPAGVRTSSTQQRNSQRPLPTPTLNLKAAVRETARVRNVFYYRKPLRFQGWFVTVAELNLTWLKLVEKKRFGGISLIDTAAQDIKIFLFLRNTHTCEVPLVTWVFWISQ